MKMLDHPNILKTYTLYVDDNYYYVVSELCKGGELLSRIEERGYFSEKEAANGIKIYLLSN